MWFRRLHYLRRSAGGCLRLDWSCGRLLIFFLFRRLAHCLFLFAVCAQTLNLRNLGLLRQARFISGRGVWPAHDSIRHAVSLLLGGIARLADSQFGLNQATNSAIADRALELLDGEDRRRLGQRRLCTALGVCMMILLVVFSYLLVFHNADLLALQDSQEFALAGMLLSVLELQDGVDGRGWQGVGRRWRSFLRPSLFRFGH